MRVRTRRYDMNHGGEAAEHGTSDFIYKGNKSLRRETARVSSSGCTSGGVQRRRGDREKIGRKEKETKEKTEERAVKICERAAKAKTNASRRRCIELANCLRDNCARYRIHCGQAFFQEMMDHGTPSCPSLKQYLSGYMKFRANGYLCGTLVASCARSN